MKMKFTTFILVAGIFITLVPYSTEAAKINRLKQTKISLEDYLKQCWDEFVSSMSTGIPELNIPTFDPWFSEDNFPFRMQDSSMVLRADVNATNVESLGFSSVQISSYQEQGNSLYNVSLTLPDLDISGIYSAVGSHHYFYPIVGYGPFALTLRKVWSTGTTTLLFDDSDDSKIATRDSVEKVRRICRNQPNVFLHDFVGFGIDFEGGVKSCEPLE